MAFIRLELVQLLEELELEKNIKSVFKTQSGEFVQKYKPLENSVDATLVSKQTSTRKTTFSFKQTSSSRSTETMPFNIDTSTSKTINLTLSTFKDSTTSYSSITNGTSSIKSSIQRDNITHTTHYNESMTTLQTTTRMTDKTIKTSNETQAVGNMSTQIQTTVYNTT